MTTPEKVEFPVVEIHEVLIHGMDIETSRSAGQEIAAECDADRPKPKPLKYVEGDPLATADIEHPLIPAHETVIVQTHNYRPRDRQMRFGGHFR